MTIQFACPACKKALKAPDEKAGAKVKCPGCKTVFRAATRVVPEITASQISVARTNSLGPVQKLAVLALRPLAGIACTALGIPGKEIVVKGVGQVVDFLTDKFKDDSQRLSVALNDANEKAWKTLEIALAGESFWKRLTRKGEDSEFAKQIRAFLDSVVNSPDFEGKPDFRQRCIEEIRAARKNGILTGATYDASELAKQAGAFARYADPVGLIHAEWQFIGQLADALEKEKYKNLANLLKQKPSQGMPLLVIGVRYYFRRAVEEDAKLFQGLAFAKLEALGEGQAKSFARLEALGDAQKMGFDALFDAFATQRLRLEEMLSGVQAVVVETHTAVLDLHGKVDDNSVQLKQVIESVQQLLQSSNRPQRKVSPADLLSVPAEFEEWQSQWEAGSTIAWLNERVGTRLAIWKTAAEQGMIEGQVLLGDCFLSGIGVPESHFAAYQLLLPAAEKGLSSICYIVGSLLSHEDESKAFSFFRRAADGGFALAYYQVGVRYLDGLGITQDLPQAAYWLKRSTEMTGNRDAIYKLAKLYLEGGEGVPQDWKEARTLFVKALEKGKIGAKNYLEKIGEAQIEQYTQELVDRMVNRTERQTPEKSDVEAAVKEFCGLYHMTPDRARHILFNSIEEQKKHVEERNKAKLLTIKGEACIEQYMQELLDRTKGKAKRSEIAAIVELRHQYDLTSERALEIVQECVEKWSKTQRLRYEGETRIEHEMQELLDRTIGKAKRSEIAAIVELRHQYDLTSERALEIVQECVEEWKRGITELDLSSNNIDDEAATVLVNSPNVAILTKLDLSSNNIGDAGAMAIANSPHLANLSELNLSSNNIGDEGAMAIANSPYLANLSELDLSSNNVGHSGMDALLERFGDTVRLLDE